MKKRFLSALLCLILCFSLCASAFADEESSDVYEETPTASGEMQDEAVEPENTDTGEISPTPSAGEDISQADIQEDSEDILQESEAEDDASSEFDLDQDGASRGGVVSGYMTYIGEGYGVKAVNSTYSHTYSGYVTREYCVMPSSLNYNKLAYCIDSACTGPTTSTYGYWYQWNTTASDTAAVCAASFLFSYYASYNSSSGQYWNAPLLGHAPEHLWNFASASGLSSGSSSLSTYWGTYGYYHEYITYAFYGNNNRTFDGASWLNSLWQVYWNYFSPSGSSFHQDWYYDLLDYDIYIFVPSSGTSQRLITAVYNPKPYSLSITKSSSDTSITAEDDSFDLAGTTYEVYSTESDAKNGTNAIGSLVCESSGATNTLELPNPGTYYIKETVAGKNYELDTEIHTVTVSDSGTTTVNLKDVPSPQYSLSIKKSSASPNLTKGNDCYDLAGTTYAVYASESDAENAANAIGSLVCDSSGATDTLSIPNKGTYYIKETKAGKNYKLDTEIHSVTINTTGTTTVKLTDKPSTDPVNIYIRKAGTGSTPYSTASTVFKIDYYGVSVEDICDDSGSITSEKLNSMLSDSSVPHRTYYGETQSSTANTSILHNQDLISNNSVTLSDGTVLTNDALYNTKTGAFPEGIFIITEIQAAEGYNNDLSCSGTAIKSLIYTTVNNSTGDTSCWIVDPNDNITRLTGILNNTVTLEDSFSPDISTNLTDKNGDSVISAAGDTQLVDTVHIKNADSYIDGTVSISLKLVDKDSNTVAEGTASAAITSSAQDVPVEFTFDSSSAGTGSYYAVVTATFNKTDVDTAVITHNENLSDDDEIITISSIGTTLTANDTGAHVTGANKTIQLTDTVKYNGLIPGESYEITGVLMNKATNEPLLVNGEQVTASKTFTPTAASGKVRITFEFDGSLLAGTTLVAFETLYYNGAELAVHANISDSGQTVSIPSVGTVLTARDTGDHITEASESVSLTDTASYKNLVPGLSYTITGVLMLQDTGEPLLIDGKQVTATKTFTPGSANGTVKLTFTFDASALGGKTVTAFETIYYKDVEVASHKEITSTAQSLTFPEIGTTLTADDTGDHVTAADDTITLTDTIAYDGLIPGKSYRVTGTLMDKSTGEAIEINGAPVTSEKTFTPETSVGTVELTFEFDGSLIAGTTVVAFETVYYKDKEVAVHADINDENQSTNLPKISTVLTSDDTGDHVTEAGTSVSLTDKTTYKNLLPGEPYEITGTLMLDGEPLIIGGKQVTVTKTFTPTDANGNVSITFTFDASALGGKTITAFESVSYKGLEIASHKDSTSASQSVSFPEIGTTLTSNTTSDHIAEASDTIRLTDTIAFDGLVPAKSYRITGTLMDKSTGKPIEVNGKEVTAERTFTPKTSSGTVTITFTFDSSLLSGTTVVAFETVYYKDKEVAVHADIDDEDQSTHLPKISTVLTADDTGDHITEAAKNIRLTDVLSYENLIPGKTYTVSGYLVNQTTGAPLTVNDKNITAEAEFTPDSPDGTVSLTFDFDATSLAGSTVVAFESVYYHGKEIGVHEDIESAAQSVSFAEIGTTLTADDTEEHITEARENISLTDEIAFKGLIPAKSYRVTGTLMDRSTGEAIEVNGKPVTAEKTFTPDTSSGTVEITFEFDGSLLAGTTVVAFETVYYNNKEVAVHADIDDNDQSVLIPSIGTTLIADDTDEHITEAEKKVRLTDLVDFEDLIPAKSYRVVGILMDRTTGEPLLVNGEQITAETTFTPETSGGTIPITFEFDGSLLAGTTVVAFETLYYNNKEVAVHADITSVSQTLSFPEIGTTLTADNSGEHVTGADEKITLTDTVKYTGLIAGKRYVVEGVLMNRSTGEPLLANGEQVTAKKTFTAKDSDGSVSITFEFDGSLLAGTTVVAYETLSYKGIEVAVHADIHDDSQSTAIPHIGTTLTSNDTEDHIAGNNETLELTDEIAYENLVPGLEYSIEGTLMVKTDDGCEPLTVNGKKITSETVSFTPAAKDGTVSVTFTFDASALDGKTLVAYEYLYLGKELIASHEDPDNEDQTLYIPELHTTAADSETHNHTSYADTEVTIIDSVQYSNLITDGREYTVTGVLVNKETGEMIEVNGEPVTAGTKFVPEEPTGSVDVEFTFDGSLLAGTTTVAFEALYYKGIEIGFHMSIDDEAQTVVFPKVGTQARDKSDKDNSVARNSTVTVVDTLSYEGLTEGSTYVAEAFLVDAKGNVVTVNGMEVTGTLEFTPDASDGKAEVEMTFNTSGLSDANYTVFEYVYEKIETEPEETPAAETEAEPTTENVLIASHTDLTNTDQQIKLDTPVPNVKTGDSTNVWPYIILALVCVVGVAACIIVKKRFSAGK